MRSGLTFGLIADCPYSLPNLQELSLPVGRLIRLEVLPRALCKGTSLVIIGSTVSP